MSGSTGACALARGAIEAAVSLVTGYPGAPATAVVNRILELTSLDEGAGRVDQQRKGGH